MNPLAADNKPVKLFRNYRIELLVQLDVVRRREAAKNPPAEVDPKIEKLLTDARQWSDLYEAEQRLAVYASPEEVRADFTRRVVEGTHLGVKSVAGLQADYTDDKATDASRMATYRSLLSDVHFRYDKRSLDRDTRESTVASYNWCGLAIFFSMAAFLLYVFNKGLPTDARLLNLVTVGMFGMMGAFFSRLTSLNTNSNVDYDQMVLTYRFRNLVLRMIVGVIAAIILYYLIYGGLLSGDLFPKQESLVSAAGLFEVQGLLVPTKEMAKLMVWSFLAGFSERLVTGTLELLEKPDNERKDGAGIAG